MAVVYCTKSTAFNADEAEDLLNKVDVSRVSVKPANAAKGSDVYVYNYENSIIKGILFFLKIFISNILFVLILISYLYIKYMRLFPKVVA